MVGPLTNVIIKTTQHAPAPLPISIKSSKVLIQVVSVLCYLAFTAILLLKSQQDADESDKTHKVHKKLLLLQWEKFVEKGLKHVKWFYLKLKNWQII